MRIPVTRPGRPPRESRLVVFGGGGQLAQELIPRLTNRGWAVTPVIRRECDIRDAAAVDRILDQHRPLVVINCAAYTQVDQAEKNPDLAFAVNAVGAGNVARSAGRVGATLVHISTDYVFDGLKSTPYSETDPPAPLGVYARSKYAGELEVQQARVRHYVVRTGELYGDGGRNFFHQVLDRAARGLPLRVVADQLVTPTWTRELAEQVAIIIEGAPPGLYHATARGEASWFDAARAALRFVGLDVQPQPISTEELGSPTPRPRNSVLAHDALERLGLYRMAGWRESLGQWLAGRHA